MSEYTERKVTTTVNVRAGRGVKFDIAGEPYRAGEIVMVFEEKSGWGRVGENQWINLAYTEPV